MPADPCLTQEIEDYMAVDNICRWWLGPVWKTGGETCVCVLPTGHDGWHRCTCSGEWQKCGHPPEEVTS